MIAFPLSGGNLLFGQDRRSGGPALFRDAFGKTGIGSRIVADPGRANEPSAPILAKQ
jgi:hypothetical protein